MPTPIEAADLFCGAGGTSTGLVHACHKRGLTINLLAVNHWARAVETHTRNHPWARHLCADLSSIDPSEAIPGGSLRILVASPECTHHSNARGGKPRSDQSRASAWHVLHWAERLNIDDILIENVAEFQSWGPLTKAGKPMKRRKGATFDAFINALRAMGYVVDHRVCNAADYGDATTRRRLFIQARRGRRISWPELTHAGKWRAAREIIDWDLHGQSIFTRKRPLSKNTLARIEAGLKKFGGEPFLAVLRGTSPSHCEASAQSIDEPIRTLCANGRHMYLAEPFVVSFDNGSSKPTGGISSVHDPVGTIIASNPRFGLVEPFIIHTCHAGGDRVRSVETPLPTIPAGHRGELALIQPQPFLTKYYGTATAVSVEDPLDTVTVQDRFALVEPKASGTRMDILFRMLTPRELGDAMGFEGYEITGNKTQQVKQIGNAVPVHMAEALCGNLLSA